MSRILSYPCMGQLKLYQVNSYLHMSSLRKCFKNIIPEKGHKTSYKFLEPDTFIHIKEEENDYILDFDHDKVLCKTLKLFQQKLAVPSNTCIDVQFRRSIIDKQHEDFWKTYNVSKVGIVNVTQRKQYKFRDATTNFNHDINIFLDQGQMICYNENNIIEFLLMPSIEIDNDSVVVSDQIVLTVT